MTDLDSSTKTSPNWADVRSSFPILQETVHGKRLAYLDNAATSQKPEAVINAISTYYRQQNSNVHRAIHHLAELATQEYEGARKETARFLNVASSSDVIFTRGTTDSINLIAQGFRPELKEGAEILVTEMEHHSNLVPWQMLARATGATLRYIPVLEDGLLDLSTLDDLLNERTKIVAVSHISNILGCLNPVDLLIEKAHAVGAEVLLDAAQSVPHQKVDFLKSGADFLVFSSHKLCGPTGFGTLIADSERMNRFQPSWGGGEMIQKVEMASSTYAKSPARFEAGTPHIAGAVGLTAAIHFLESLGMDAIHERTMDLTLKTCEALKDIEPLKIIGPVANRVGAVSFSVEGIHPHDLSQYLDQQGVAIRAGHMCCQPLLSKLGFSALNRASLAFYNDEEDIAQLKAAVIKAVEFFGRV